MTLTVLPPVWRGALERRTELLFCAPVREDGCAFSREIRSHARKSRSRCCERWVRSAVGGRVACGTRRHGGRFSRGSYVSTVVGTHPRRHPLRLARAPHPQRRPPVGPRALPERPRPPPRQAGARPRAVLRRQAAALPAQAAPRPPRQAARRPARLRLQAAVPLLRALGRAQARAQRRARRLPAAAGRARLERLARPGRQPLVHSSSRATS